MGKAPVRPTVAVITLLAGALSGCGISTSPPPPLGYAPPSAQPGALGSAYAGQPAGLIWNQLLDRLIQSPLEIDLADPERGIVVASYTGDPEPYVTCGWILVNRGGALEEVPASGQASFRRVVQGRRLEVTRGMRLDARLVVEVEPDGGGAAVNTTSNYVLTKTIEAANPLGWSRGRAHEVVSFSTGERGEFSKGTVCQPNGALERIVLDVLPSMARIQTAEGSKPALRARIAGGSEPGSGSLTASRPTIETSELASTDGVGRSPLTQPAGASDPAPTGRTADGAEAALQTLTTESGGAAPAGQAVLPQPEDRDAAVAEAPASQLAEAQAAEVTEAHGADMVEAPNPEVPALEQGAVALDCPIADRIFCEVLEVTDRYRRANQERNLGLSVDVIEAGSPLVSGSDLGFDVGLPSYAAYLTVSFFLNDGTVRHVLSGWDRRWPANAREFVSDAGLSVDDRGRVEMVVALASDVQVFPSPRPASETAELYLSDLRKRLAEISDSGSAAQIAASLLVVTPA